MWDAGWLAWHGELAGYAVLALVAQGNCELGCHVWCYLAHCLQFLALGGASTKERFVSRFCAEFGWLQGESRLCSLLMQRSHKHNSERTVRVLQSVFPFPLRI